MSKIINRGSIKNYIQLVVQSNEYKYLTSSQIEDFLGFFLFKKTEKDRISEFVVKKNGIILNKKELKEDYKKPTQELKVFHINDKGQYISEKGFEIFSPQFYRKFVETKPKKLFSFIEKQKFCAFPISNEFDFDHLNKEYKKLIKRNLVLKFGESDKIIQKQNFNYILKKHLTFKMIVDNFDKNKINFASVSWLNQQIMPNVSPILLNANSFPNQELEDDEIELSRDEKDEEFLEIKEVAKSRIVKGYRIFGHLALCCFELLCDIEKYKLAKTCQNPNCKNKLSSNAHGNEKYCSNKCKKEIRKIQRRDDRKKEKNIKIKIQRRKKMPKRIL